MNISLIPAALFFCFVWFQAFEGYFIPQTILGTSIYVVLASVALNLLAYFWVLTHARENEIGLNVFLKIAVILLPVFAVPYYKIRYFGWLRGLGLIAIVLVLTFGPVGALVSLFDLEISDL